MSGLDGKRPGHGRRRSATLFVLASLFVSTAVSAAPPVRPKEKPLTSEDAERVFQIRKALESDVLLEIMTGLERLRHETHSSYAALLVALLERGGNEPVLIAAFDVAERFQHPRLSAALAPYLQHREQRVRHAAAKALSKTGGSDAALALRRALRSSDARLRGLSASGLGKVGDASIVADLFLALDHQIGAAAGSIGRLCDDAACLKLLERMGRTPFQSLSEGLVQIVVRQDDRVSAKTKIEVIAQIANLQTPKAAALLRGARSQLPEKANDEVRNALDAAIESFGKPERP